jgi:hypothetical protein
VARRSAHDAGRLLQIVSDEVKKKTRALFLRGRRPGARGSTGLRLTSGTTAQRNARAARRNQRGGRRAPPVGCVSAEAAAWAAQRGSVGGPKMRSGAQVSFFFLFILCFIILLNSKFLNSNLLWIYYFKLTLNMNILASLL